jgi:hypothetical protein
MEPCRWSVGDRGFYGLHCFDPSVNRVWVVIHNLLTKPEVSAGICNTTSFNCDYRGRVSTGKDYGIQ